MTSRPDLPWLRETVGLGTVVDATVVRDHPSRGLAELDIGGAVLLAPNAGLVVGASVRLRIPAREVILATEPPQGLSVHNVLSGVVTRLAADHPDVALVQLAVGRAHVLAEVTKDAVSRLQIVDGVRLHALIKSVSLEVRVTGLGRDPQSEPLISSSAS